MRRRTQRFRALDFDFDVHAPADFAALCDEWFADLIDPRVDGRRTPSSKATIDVRRRRAGWTVRTPFDDRREGDFAHAVAEVIHAANLGAVRSIDSDVCIHAAAVATANGVLVLVGASGAGKSTLAAAAVQRGFGYVSDEVAAIRRDRTVRPYHRPIGLRAGGAAALAIEVPSDADGRFDVVYPWRPDRSTLHSGGPLAGICLVHYVGPGGTDERDAPIETGWVGVRPAEALIELSATAFDTAGGDDRERFRVLASLVTDIPVVRLQYATPDDGIDQLVDFSAANRSAGS